MRTAAAGLAWRRALAGATLLWAMAAGAAFAQAPWRVTRPAGGFDRAQLNPPGDPAAVRRAGSLAGGRGPVTGRFEYDLEIAAAGWYVLGVEGPAQGVDFVVDPDSPGRQHVSGGNGTLAGREKVGNFWLAAGGHVLRLERQYWTGFPAIRAITLEAADGSLGETVSAALTSPAVIFRKGECADLEVRAGARAAPAVLNAWVFKPGEPTLASLEVRIPASPGLHVQRVKLPCREEGRFAIGFGEAGKRLPTHALRDLAYEVVDTAPAAASAPLRMTLVHEIDATTTPPDYSGGELSRVVAGAAGRYRESGTAGWLKQQNLPALMKKVMPAPSWFGYVLHGLRPQVPHRVEVDYPDDAQRSFAIALRERAPLDYPVAAGVDAGGEFSLSHSMQTHSILFWPRAPETRVLFLNAHDGRRAAAARIRVYRLDGDLPPLAARGEGGRHFVNWYEEGSNFASMYGAPERSPQGYQLAADRWARAAAHMGADVLAPTVAIYSFALYPSRYNLAFGASSEYDLLRRLLLIGEKHGQKILPELHPRADELGWPYAAAPDPKPHLLVSKDGKTGTGLPPLFNPLFAPNQDWYVGMIGELADNYAWSPALMGVSLRLMQWANPALNNFHSLDWGYDDFTVGLFAKETGRAVPMGQADDPSRFARRHRWIMDHAREAWIDWRCEKIAQLYRRIVERVRRARPDLHVYSTAFDAYPSGRGASWLREAGIDPARLAKIDGVVLVNALHAYGRRYDDLVSQGSRDNLADPQVLDSLRGTAQGRFLSYARYLEATEALAPPAQLGFPADTRQTWTSGVLNPAGDHALERFAVQLAHSDAVLLGDGGNGYSLGQPVLREFLETYRALPARPFSPRADARDPVAVWEAEFGGERYFYAVNRERFPVTLELRLAGTGRFTPLAGGAAASSAEGAMRIVLAPYRLRAFKGPAGLRIERASAIVPEGELERLREQAAWLSALAGQMPGPARALRGEDKAFLRLSADAVAAALRRGHTWRARTALEDQRMLAIYLTLRRFPPHWRGGG